MCEVGILGSFDAGDDLRRRKHHRGGRANPLHERRRRVHCCVLASAHGKRKSLDAPLAFTRICHRRVLDMTDCKTTEVGNRD
jgi:hypothetical protein